MSFPGTGKPDHYGPTTNTPTEIQAARRVITWHARTDADERRLLELLGLDPIPYQLTDHAHAALNNGSPA